MARSQDLAAAGLGYLVGSLPFGLWLGRARRGIDIREHGSGSSGATNVLRVAGPAAAAATFALDTAKGAVSVGLARQLGAGPNGVVAAGLGAMVGHSWPMFAHFRGGKSVATAFGGLVVLSPSAARWSVAGGMTALVTTRIVSVGSLSAAASATAGAALELSRTRRSAPLAFAGLATALIAVRHAPNLRRLVDGREPRLSWRRSPPTRA